MHTGARIPKVSADAPLREALLEITRQGLGMAVVVDSADRVLGVYTDGDLRRTLDKGIDVHNTVIGEVMTQTFKHARPGMLAVEALKLMEDHKISALPVIDEDGRLAGAMNMHDLLRAGVV